MAIAMPAPRDIGDSAGGIDPTGWRDNASLGDLAPHPFREEKP
jgi:hypothetical protein